MIYDNLSLIWHKGRKCMDKYYINISFDLEYFYCKCSRHNLCSKSFPKWTLFISGTPPTHLDCITIAIRIDKKGQLQLSQVIAKTGLCHVLVNMFSTHGLTLISAWISNHNHYKVWEEITYPFPNFNGCTIEVWEWISYFILHFIMDVITIWRAYSNGIAEVECRLDSVLTAVTQKPTFNGSIHGPILLTCFNFNPIMDK